MSRLFDRYGVQGRLFPSIISSLPLLVLAFFLSEDVELKELGRYLQSVKPYAGFGVSAVALYFYAQVIRFVSKLIEDSYFIRGPGFPTTYLMTYADGTHSKDYKDRYRGKVKRDFGMDLLDETQERQDPEEAKKRLAEATKQVILKVRKGQLVFKHNVWYGFIRNLIGGAVFSLAFCALNILLGFSVLKSHRLIAVSLALAIPYVFLIIFWKPLLKQNAEAYAEQLIAEYMHAGINDTES